MGSRYSQSPGAVPDLPYLEEITHREFPRLAIVPLPLGRVSISLPGVERVDGVVLPAERGSYYTLLYPAFSVAVPHPLAIRFALAYPVGRRDLEFARFLGIWIDLQRKTGLSSSFMIIGSSVAMRNPSNPCWSVIRHVLHWVNSSRLLKKLICFVALDRFRVNVQKSTPPLIDLRAPRL